MDTILQGPTGLHTVWLREYEPRNATMVDKRGRNRECRLRNSHGLAIAMEWEQRHSPIPFGQQELRPDNGGPVHGNNRWRLVGMAVYPDGNRESLYEKV